MTYRMYPHMASVSSEMPIIKFEKLANVYKPNRPNTPLRMYMMIAIAKKTVGVRAALNMFLLSLCAWKLAYWSSRSISSCSRYAAENVSPPIFRFEENCKHNAV